VIINAKVGNDNTGNKRVMGNMAVATSTIMTNVEPTI
jgi:hypothetical protein